MHLALMESTEQEGRKKEQVKKDLARALRCLD